MKKARKVVIPEDGRLDEETYEELAEHAFNSALWYASNYLKSRRQLAEKLYAKGYVAEDVILVREDGAEEQHNMVEEALVRLEEIHVYSDRDYAESFMRGKLSNGLSLSRARQELRMQGIDDAIIQEVQEELEEFHEDTVQDAFDMAFRRVVNTSAFKSADARKQRERLLRNLMGKGFAMDAIIEAHERWLEGAVDEGETSDDLLL